MSVVIRYAPDGLTSDQYERASSLIQERLAWPPDGLEMHVCFGSEGDLKVSEIWESQEQLDAFGAQIAPLLEEVGIEMASEPEVFSIHRLEVYNSSHLVAS